MKQIQGLTDQPNQQSTLVLPDGSRVAMTLEYRAQQQAWFFDLSWPDPTTPFVMNGCRLVSGPNLLRDWRELIPFGLAVTTNDGLDPVEVGDFINGTATLYLLNPTDVAQVETQFFPGL